MSNPFFSENMKKKTKKKKQKKKKKTPICRLLNKPRGWLFKSRYSYVRLCDLDIPRDYLKQNQTMKYRLSWGTGRRSKAFQYPDYSKHKPIRHHNLF